MLAVVLEQVYDIIGVCQRREEVIDVAQNKEEADKLVGRYKIEYGRGWKIFKRIQRQFGRGYYIITNNNQEIKNVRIC